MIPIIRPDVEFAEVEEALREIVASGRLTQGPYVQRFEEAVAREVGVAHAVATTSATTALHLGLVALGIAPGDEVLVSDFSFPATGNVVVQLGAVPVLVDSAEGSFAIDPDAAAAAVTERTKGIVPVDPFGQPADMVSLEALALRHGLALVEDAACALGSSIDGRACGSFTGVGCFSFHPRKVVTSGEGGAITTDDGALAEKLRMLRTHGGVAQEGVGLLFVENGFNYRMSEIQAALALPQMARLGQIMDDRAATADRYRALLAGMDGVEAPAVPAGHRWSHQSFVVLLADSIDRDRVVRQLSAGGVETTLGTYAMHAHPAFARFGYRPGDLPRSYDLQRRSLTLPLLPRMTSEDVTTVVEGLAEAVGRA
jgi:perosamine synthetase